MEGQPAFQHEDMASRPALALAVEAITIYIQGGVGRVRKEGDSKLKPRGSWDIKSSEDILGG